MTRDLLMQRAVAERLNMTYDQFSRRKAGLIAGHGFPPPVAGCGNRWDPEAIDAWLDRQLEAAGVSPVVHIDRARDVDILLDERARAIAAGGAE